MKEPSRDLLTTSCPEGARALLRRQLDNAVAAARRLKHPDDAEALHDFRVALRRLGTTLRFYKSETPGIGRKRRRQLRGYGKATNPGRDAEVQLGWLTGQQAGLSPRQRIGCQWLMRRLAKRQGEAGRAAQTAMARRFIKLSEKLWRQLEPVVLVAAADGNPAAGIAPHDSPVTGLAAGASTLPGFAPATAALAQTAARALLKSLAKVDHAAGERVIHRARIRAKRLRYLLDPLRPELARVRPVISQLKKMQDALGELHDLQLLDAHLLAALKDAALERSHALYELSSRQPADAAALRRLRSRNEQAGLLELARRVRQRQAELFTAVSAEAGKAERESLRKHLATITAALASN